jgi:hypothetical protein
MTNITKPQQRLLERIAEAEDCGSAIEAPERSLRALVAKRLLFITPILTLDRTVSI